MGVSKKEERDGRQQGILVRHGDATKNGVDIPVIHAGHGSVELSNGLIAASGLCTL
jgi:hypothetical protein